MESVDKKVQLLARLGASGDIVSYFARLLIHGNIKSAVEFIPELENALEGWEHIREEVGELIENEEL